MKTPLHCFRTIILLIATFSIYSCTDVDDLEVLGNADNVIAKNSEFYTLLTEVTNKETDSLDQVVCLDFIYPLTLIIYNQNLQQIGTQPLIGDEQFSSFLGNLPADHLISISYPISTTLSDGTVFSVNNNTELKLAIDSCTKEDIITYYGGLFGGGLQSKCVWKVPYNIETNNKYATGIFNTNHDGTLNFKFNEQTYDGTWTFLFVNEELHININLEGDSEVALDWNIDRKVELNGNKILIIDTPKNTVLEQYCESTITYQIGDTGPADGIVFYDKGFYSEGWRYMEVNPADLGVYEWGCFGSAIQATGNTAIGKGWFNSVAIVNYHDILNNYYIDPTVCNVLNNGTVAAQTAITYNSPGFNDWFLPSEEELKLVYLNLYLLNQDGFSEAKYWSSTEVDAQNARTIDFSTGNSEITSKIPDANTVKTRAVRYF